MLLGNKGHIGVAYSLRAETEARFRSDSSQAMFFHEPAQMGRDLVANEVVAKGRRWLHYKLPLVEFIVLSVFLWKFEKLFKADPGSGAHNCLPRFRGIRRFIFYPVLGESAKTVCESFVRTRGTSDSPLESQNPGRRTLRVLAKGAAASSLYNLKHRLRTTGQRLMGRESPV